METTISLELGGPTVGEVVIATDGELSDEQREQAVELLRPLALGFSNVLLLQEITRTAIKEERVRLARELHDEIGPSLASLGLALDVALVQGVEDPTLTGNLERLRSDVSMLVEEVRATVADLRSAGGESLSQAVLKAAARAVNGTDVVVDLRENRPPAPRNCRRRRRHRHRGDPQRHDPLGCPRRSGSRAMSISRGAGFRSAMAGGDSMSAPSPKVTSG